MQAVLLHKADQKRTGGEKKNQKTSIHNDSQIQIKMENIEKKILQQIRCNIGLTGVPSEERKK